MDEYPKMFLVGVDNVGSKQMQQIRQSLRGRAEVLMGKNTMIRKAIRGHLENNPALERYCHLKACYECIEGYPTSYFKAFLEKFPFDGHRYTIRLLF